jgi:hypothetical protein
LLGVPKEVAKQLLFTLNAQLLAAVKPSSTTTNRFAAAIIAQS